METLLLYLLSSLGMSCIWSLSDLFIPVRNFVAKKIPNPFKKMLLCMECSSFWIGAFNGLIFGISNNLFFFSKLPYYLQIAAFAFFGGSSVHLFVKILNKYLNKETYN